MNDEEGRSVQCKLADVEQLCHCVYTQLRVSGSTSRGQPNLTFSIWCRKKVWKRACVLARQGTVHTFRRPSSRSACLRDERVRRTWP